MTCLSQSAVKVLTPIVAEFDQQYLRHRALIDASDRVKDLAGSRLNNQEFSALLLDRHVCAVV